MFSRHQNGNRIILQNRASTPENNSSAPGDVVRRLQPSDQRSRLAQSSRFSSPLSHSSAGMHEDNDGKNNIGTHTYMGHLKSSGSPQGKASIKLASRKSLHQRFDFDATTGESTGMRVCFLVYSVGSSPCVGPSSSERVTGRSHPSGGHSGYHADPTHAARSRSVSVVSSLVERTGHGQEEDISSVMMRGATDLRNAKYEIEELVSLGYPLRRFNH